jgi:hypothetical protein
MKELIARILRSDVVSENPPVCVDIGASGALPSEWRVLAPHSICVAFDADTREFRVDDESNGGWKRLIKLNRLVAEKPIHSIDFFLTKSPFCSSSLHPDNAALEPWAFSGLFEVQRRVSLPAVSLTGTLTQLGIDQIDWYKSDTQGTDLRIFASLASEMINQVIVADFEPGIIDAYRGEDKLFEVMGFMNSRPFFLSDMRIWGSQRIDRAGLRSLGAVPRKFVSAILKMSPGWCEVTYLNDFSAASDSKRRYYLGWVFSAIKKQDGHALAIAERGLRMFGDSVFDECRRASLRQMRARYPRLALHLVTRLLARVVGRWGRR